MKISRWIYVPLICALYSALLIALFGGSFSEVLSYFVVGAISGFVLQFWSDIKARRVSGRNDEEIYKIKQNRSLTLLMNYEKAFESCVEAVNLINPAKIKRMSLESGIITARTKMSWSSTGNTIQINLKRINENLTQIEISTNPIPRTAIVDYGDGWKYAEDICSYLKEKDMEINRKVLVESVDLLNDVYVKPFQKEKIRRR